MAAFGTGASGLQISLSGATENLGCQEDPDASLGGFQSAVVNESMGWERQNPLDGIRVLLVAAKSGVGEGLLRATGASTVTWTPPGGAVGSEVTIANGETLVIESADADEYIVIKRTSATALRGAETVVVNDTFNNVIGFDNVESAEASAGDVEYRAVFLENISDVDLSQIVFWLESAATLALGKEAPASNEIQTIADEDTAPGGIAWNTGVTQGVGLIIPGLAPGETYGLWIRRTIASSAVASVKETNVIHFAFDTPGSVEHLGDARGLYRIANDALSVYELYRGVGASPDFTAPPFETFTSLPHTTAVLAANAVYHFALRLRNEFGILTQNINETLVTIDAGGDEVVTKPSNPEGVVAVPAAGGTLNITGTYIPAEDGDNRADTWVIWMETDGTTPDPDVDAPLDTVSMGTTEGVEVLNFTTPADLHNTFAKIIVRTRRSADTVDSDSTTVTTATFNTIGPIMPNWDIIFGDIGNQNIIAAPPGSFDVFWVDQGNNIFLQPDERGVSFYADTELIWRFVSGGPSTTGTLYIPSDWDLVNATISGAGGSDPIEVAAWNGVKTLYVVVDGVRACKIDVTNKEISMDTFIQDTPAQVTAQLAVFQAVGFVYFQSWNCATAAWSTYLTIDATEWEMEAEFNQLLTQVQIEAL